MFDVLHVAPPSKLYSAVKPFTTLKAGMVKAELHVLETTGAFGADGKITTFTVLLAPHAPVPAVPASVVPQSAART